MQIQLDDVTLTLEDIKDALRLRYDKERFHLTWSSIALTGVGLINLIQLGILRDDQIGMAIGVGSTVLGIILFYLRFVHLGVILPRMLHKAFNAFSPSQVTIDDTGVIAKSKTTEGVYKWEAVEDSREGSTGLLLLLQGGNNLMYFPRRFFTKEQYTELVERIVIRRIQRGGD